MELKLQISSQLLIFVWLAGFSPEWKPLLSEQGYGSETMPSEQSELNLLLQGQSNPLQGVFNTGPSGVGYLFKKKLHVYSVDP